MAVRELEYDEILAIAEAIDVHPNPALGQYFIHDRDVVRRITSTCDVHKRDRVLEIGSGMGAPLPPLPT